MMRTLATIAFMYLAVALPANNALAQQRLVFKVDAEDTKYTQQHTVDVGDVSGHQVRILRWRMESRGSPHLSQQRTRYQRDEDRGIVDPWRHRLHQQ